MDIPLEIISFCIFSVNILEFKDAYKLYLALRVYAFYQNTVNNLIHLMEENKATKWDTQNNLTKTSL